MKQDNELAATPVGTARKLHGIHEGCREYSAMASSRRIIEGQHGALLSMRIGEA